MKEKSTRTLKFNKYRSSNKPFQHRNLTEVKYNAAQKADPLRYPILAEEPCVAMRTTDDPPEYGKNHNADENEGSQQ